MTGAVVPPLPDYPVSVLLVSTQPSDHRSLAAILGQSNWNLEVRGTCSGALSALRRNSVPVIICDDESTGGEWQRLLEDVAGLPEPPALIVSSRLADERLWARVLNLGGYDVLPTPFDRAEVLQVCFQAWKHWERESRVVRIAAAGSGAGPASRCSNS